MRMVFLALALLAGCSPPPIPPPPEGACTTKVRLPYPPIPQKRSIPVIITWANTAAETANRAIDERDTCAQSYARLKDWADDAVKSQGVSP